MPLRKLVIAACLVLPCIAVLAVPLYNRIEPAWNGIPFFYWYQLVWAPLSAVSIGVAYLLTERGSES